MHPISAKDVAFAKSYGKSYSRHCRAQSEHDELISAALFGLVRASKTYDPSRGVSWFSWSTKRISYACWYVFEKNRAKMRGYDVKHVQYGGEKFPGSGTFWEVGEEPKELVEPKLSEGFKQLPKRHQEALEGFVADKSFAEIGKNLKISRTRAEQIAKAGLERLREYFLADKPIEQRTKGFASNRKLTFLQAEQIRFLHSLGGYSLRDLSKHYGIHKKTVERIVIHESYRS